jgi:flagellar motor switch/type III secretory pathway protein FliN
VATPFPFDDLPRLARDDVAITAALARWLAIRPKGRRLEALIGDPITLATTAIATFDDSNAGSCAVRVTGATIEVRGTNALVRRIAQRLLGGPAELAAARPLNAAEHAVWALVVAAAVEDLGIAGEVWPCDEPPVIADARELVLGFNAAGAPATIAIRAPRTLELRVPPARVPAWPASVMVEIPIVIGRCAITRDAIAALAPRSIITLEAALGHAELVVLGGSVGLAIADGELVAAVTTGYVSRSMALPDDAHVELTVGLGTTQLTLRQVFELAVGQVVPLGRPLAGPFEIRAAGKLVGRGELVNVDGELGVRIVSLEE